MDNMCRDVFNLVVLMCHSDDICTLRCVNKTFNDRVCVCLNATYKHIAVATRDRQYYGCNKDRLMAYSDCMRIYRPPRAKLDALRFIDVRIEGQHAHLYYVGDVLLVSLVRFRVFAALVRYNKGLALASRKRELTRKTRNAHLRRCYLSLRLWLMFLSH